MTKKKRQARITFGVIDNKIDKLGGKKEKERCKTREREQRVSQKDSKKKKIWGEGEEIRSNYRKKKTFFEPKGRMKKISKINQAYLSLGLEIHIHHHH